MTTMPDPPAPPDVYCQAPPPPPPPVFVAPGAPLVSIAAPIPEFSPFPPPLLGPAPAEQLPPPPPPMPPSPAYPL